MGHCWGQNTPGNRWQIHKTGSCACRWWSSGTNRCCCWHWCMHRTDPLREGGTGVGEEGRGESGKQRVITTLFQKTILTIAALKKSYWSLCCSSLVQKGAVCQWWLSWTKQVRPGMLQVSLFWSLLMNLRSFFLRFCSFWSHWFFSFDGILIRTKPIQ